MWTWKVQATYQIKPILSLSLIILITLCVFLVTERPVLADPPVPPPQPPVKAPTGQAMPLPTYAQSEKYETEGVLDFNQKDTDDGGEETEDELPRTDSENVGTWCEFMLFFLSESLNLSIYLQLPLPSVKFLLSSPLLSFPPPSPLHLPLLSSPLPLSLSCVVCSAFSVVGFLISMCVATTVAAKGGAVAGLGIALAGKPIMFEVSLHLLLLFSQNIPPSPPPPPFSNSVSPLSLSLLLVSTLFTPSSALLSSTIIICKNVLKNNFCLFHLLSCTMMTVLSGATAPPTPQAPATIDSIPSSAFVYGSLDFLVSKHDRAHLYIL